MRLEQQVTPLDQADWRVAVLPPVPQHRGQALGHVGPQDALRRVVAAVIKQEQVFNALPQVVLNPLRQNCFLVFELRKHAQGVRGVAAAQACAQAHRAVPVKHRMGCSQRPGQARTFDKLFWYAVGTRSPRLWSAAVRVAWLLLHTSTAKGPTNTQSSVAAPSGLRQVTRTCSW